MKRLLVLAAAAVATLFIATAANAGGVHWSVGINLPPVATVVSSGPAYYPAPYYRAPVYAAPAYYPEPVYYSAPTYYPAPVVYAPRPRIWVPPVRPYYGGHWHGHGRGHDKVHHRHGRGHDKAHHGRRADWRR